MTALPDVARFGFAQVDLDCLTEENQPLLAVDAIRGALVEATNRGASVDGLMVVPLEPAEVARHDCPEWPALLHSFEVLRGPSAVPGMYLLAPGHPVSNTDDAEYMAPVAIPPEVGSGISGFCRMWRTAVDRARGWEHDRTVYLRVGL